MPPKKQYGTQKAFRFSETDLAYLEQLVQDVSLSAGKNVSATEVIRGALKIASQANPKEVYSATLEVQIEQLQAELKGEQDRLKHLPSGGNIAITVENDTYRTQSSSIDCEPIDLVYAPGFYFDINKLEFLIDRGDHFIVVKDLKGLSDKAKENKKSMVEADKKHSETLKKKKD